MTPVTYRTATVDDLEAIGAIARHIWTMGLTKRLEDRFGRLGDKSWDEWTGEDIVRAVRGALPRCLVAECDGEVVGWVSWSVNDARGQGQIGYNGVAPVARGLGIGTALVQRALAELRTAGCKVAIVVTGLDDGHAPARRVYEKCGFEPFHQSVTYVQEL